MAREVKMPYFLLMRDQFEFWRDFENLTTAQDGLTTLVADAGSSAAGTDGAGGLLVLGTGGTLNNEAAVRSTNELFIVGNNKVLVAEARIQYAEASTNLANIAFGLGDAAGADFLLDGGAGPRTSGNQVLIYKVAGETAWRCQARNGTQFTTTLSGTQAGGAAYQTLRIEIHDMSLTQATVYYQVDGVQLRDPNVSVGGINHQLNL